MPISTYYRGEYGKSDAIAGRQGFGFPSFSVYGIILSFFIKAGQDRHCKSIHLNDEEYIYNVEQDAVV